MKAATYNPDTLKRINQGATALDLGWDDYFYSHVCRKHGIPPNVTTPKTHAIAEIAATPSEPPPPPVTGDTVFDPITREVRRGAVVIQLAGRQADVFSYIIRATPEKPISGAAIAKALGIPAQLSVGAHVTIIRKKILPLDLAIGTIRTRGHSGYYVCEPHTGMAVKVERVGK